MAQEQTDSLVTFDEIEISATALHNQSVLDRVFIENVSLADAINVQSAWFMKENSPGNLSTISAEGLPTKYTELRWNDIRLNSRMNGFTDLNLLSTHTFTSISLEPNGIVHVNSDDFSSDHSVSIGVASFGSKHINAVTHFAKGKLNLSLRAELSNNQNDFTYLTYAENEKEMMNAFSRLGNIGGLLKYKLSGNSYIKWDTWFHKSYREIPPTLVQTLSSSFQEDDGLKSYLSLNFDKRKISTEIYSALITENIYYSDSVVSIDAANNAFTALVGSEIGIAPSAHFFFEVDLSSEYTRAGSDSYLDRISQETRINENLHSLKIKGIYKSLQDFDLQMEAEIAAVNRNTLPLRYSILADYELLNSLLLVSSYKKSFIRPTINDRYWKVGGNIDLLTEHSDLFDIGLNYQPSSRIKIDLNYFQNRIENQIIWVPGDTYWYATNAGSYKSYGISTSIKFFKSFEKLNFLSKMNYQWVKASSINASGANQFPLYVPEHKWAAYFLLKRDKWSLSSQNTYCHNVYTRTDGLSLLDSYFLSELKLGREFELEKNGLQASLSVHNLFNNTYQMIQHRPMPGRHFSFTLKYILHNE